MPDDPSPDQTSTADIYQNDPYRNRRLAARQNTVTWQCPSKTTHSYLPYSCYANQRQQQQLSTSTPGSATQENGFYIEQLDHGDPAGRGEREKEIRQDSLLTTITTTARPTSSAISHPYLQSTVTTLSLSEELRRQKEQQDGSGWWKRRKNRQSVGKRPHCHCRLSWRWICFIVVCSLLCLGGILLFICLPRLPLVIMAQTADTYGQESADWGPPLHPFYRTTWQLNLTFDNRPNFIPLHLVQIDLTLYIHPSTSWNVSTTATPSSTPSINASFTTAILSGSSSTSMATPFLLPTPTPLPSSSSSPSFSLPSSLLSSLASPPTSTSKGGAPTNNIAINTAMLLSEPSPIAVSRYTDESDATETTAVPFAWAILPPMTLWNDGQSEVANALFHIDYVAPTSNLTDPTFAQLYTACGPHLINNPPALNVSLHVTFHLLHYPWLPTMVIYPADGNGLICPSS